MRPSEGKNLRKSRKEGGQMAWMSQANSDWVVKASGSLALEESRQTGQRCARMGIVYQLGVSITGRTFLRVRACPKPREKNALMHGCYFPRF